MALVPTLQRDAKQLEYLFNRLFAEELNTHLMGGAEEPVYLPADADHRHHRLFYREDYFASALHEIAHWCVAGAARRQQVDFGYWYAPDGRSPQQQAAFEMAEVKPQALEWIFTEAAGCRFEFSADNLDAGLGASRSFIDAVSRQRQIYLEAGLPDRAERWRSVLLHHFAAAQIS